MRTNMHTSIQNTGRNTRQTTITTTTATTTTIIIIIIMIIIIIIKKPTITTIIIITTTNKQASKQTIKQKVLAKQCSMEISFFFRSSKMSIKYIQKI